MCRWSVVVLFFLLWIPGSANAELPLIVEGNNSRLTLDIESRIRYELSDVDFNSATGWGDLATLRTMLGLRYRPSDLLLLRFQWKESRFLGVEGNNKSPGASLTLQESFLRIDPSSGSPLALQVGRFELVSGRQRLLGAGDWNLYGRRSYDGVLAEWQGAEHTLSAAALKLTEQSQAAVFNALYGTSLPASNADRSLFVIRESLLGGRLQPLLLLDIDNGSPERNRYNTIALYAGGDVKIIRIDLDVAWQMGEVNGRDLSAWLLAVEGRYSPNCGPFSSFGLGVDMTSGNSYKGESASNPDHVFYAPYMRRHRYRGYMDYFRDVQRGLIDSYLKLAFKSDKTAVTIDLHNVSNMEPDLGTYASGETYEYRQLGQELDLRARFPLHPGVTLDCAWCLFLPSEEWKPNGATGQFIYAAFIAVF